MELRIASVFILVSILRTAGLDLGGARGDVLKEVRIIARLHCVEMSPAVNRLCNPDKQNTSEM